MLLRNNGCLSGAGEKRAVSASSVSGFTLTVGIRLFAYTKKGAAWNAAPEESLLWKLELLAQVHEEPAAKEVVLRCRDDRAEQRRDTSAADGADLGRPRIEQVADAGGDFQPPARELLRDRRR